jgi:hypothetical protein
MTHLAHGRLSRFPQEAAVSLRLHGPACLERSDTIDNAQGEQKFSGALAIDIAGIAVDDHDDSWSQSFSQLHVIQRSTPK